MPKIKIRYHRVRDGRVLNGQPLESVLRRVLGRRINGSTVLESWRLREWSDPEADPPRVLLANHLRPSAHNIFGDLLSFRPGQIDSILERDDEAASEANTTRLDLGNHRSIVRNFAYWLSSGNDLILCTNGISSYAINAYINWIIRSNTDLLRQEPLKITPAVPFNGGDLSTIKEITIGEQLVVRPGRKTEKSIREKRRKGIITEGEADSGKLLDILKAIVEPPERADRVLQQIPEDQKVGWSLTLKFLRPSNEASRAALMDAHELVAGLENPPKIAFKTANGTVRGDDLTLVREVEIGENPPGLWDRNEVLRQMQAALAGWRAADRI